jgi:hypothetical protein
VEKLCIVRAKAVENPTPKSFSARDANDPERARVWTGPSRVASLDRRAGTNKINAARNSFPDNQP